MKKSRNTLIFPGFILVLLIAVAGCGKPGPAEKAGQEVDKAAEKVGQKVEQAGDRIKDAAKGEKR